MCLYSLQIVDQLVWSCWALRRLKEWLSVTKLIVLLMDIVQQRELVILSNIWGIRYTCLMTGWIEIFMYINSAWSGTTIIYRSNIILTCPMSYFCIRLSNHTDRWTLLIRSDGPEISINPPIQFRRYHLEAASGTAVWTNKLSFAWLIQIRSDVNQIRVRRTISQYLCGDLSMDRHIM